MTNNQQTCLISRRIEFDMGHRVPSHNGKCKGLHGHRYVVEASVQGTIISAAGASDEGMVIDFGVIKELMMQELHDRFDHGLMLYEKDPLAELLANVPNQKLIIVPFIPTAECIAKYSYELLSSALRITKGLTLAQIKVNETPSAAAYFPSHCQ
jgi:6-pyruvoyltetrahydropterin/6-carboxytetrahydropterin synthase